MYIIIYVKYPLFLSDLKKLENFRPTFEKSLNIKFHYNSFSGSAELFQTDRHHEDVVAFCNSANAPKN